MSESKEMKQTVPSASFEGAAAAAKDLSAAAEPAAETPVVDETPAPKGGEALSRKRRTALVAYLSVLFAVAFLLVALSLVVENRHLQTSSEMNAANLNGRIAELQKEYDQMKKRADAQEKEIGELKAAGEEKDAAALALQEELEAAKAQQETLESRITELRGQLEAQTLQAADVQRAHELLYAAQLADEEGNMERLRELMEELEPLKDLLCPTAREIYDELVIA